VIKSQQNSQSNFIEDYLDYQKDTESPVIFHRWCAIAGLGALLGRDAWLQHGYTRIYPNQYIMLVGDAGSRKSTAIKKFVRLLRDAGYSKIAAQKTSKEKFLLDLEVGLDKTLNGDDHLDVRFGAKKNAKNPTMKELFGEEIDTEPRDCIIAADEFNVFMGHSNVEFIDMLTDLWDFDDIYTQRIKNSKSVRVPYPTINILSGNTNVGISESFPTAVIGQGFFSRLIMVYSDPSGRRITFPPAPDPVVYQTFINRIKEIKSSFNGQITLTKAAENALEDIYQNWKDLEDVRFKSYSTRRFTHLLKLCLITAAARGEKEISLRSIEYANSIMHYTEYFMPKALGEFGKARNSDVTAKILELIDKAERPLDILKDIWPQARRDLDNQRQLSEILRNLQAAGKIQVINGTGILPKKDPPKWDYPFCKVTLLREYLDNQAKDGLPL